MKNFMDEFFLLDTDCAKELYKKVKSSKIFDWHCHLSPQEIDANESSDLTQMWLGADHYKWRAMRSYGLPENLITGSASSYEKFLAFASVLPNLIGNPIYTWTHFELQRYFSCDIPLSSKTAREIWNICTKKIEEDGFLPQSLIERSNVVGIYTTDDPITSLKFHHNLLKKNLSFTVAPAFRPDKALMIEQESFSNWVELLAAKTGESIQDFHDFKYALSLRLDAFEAYGCRASDHGLPYIPFFEVSEDTVNRIFRARLDGKIPSISESDQFRTTLLQALAREYAKRGWVMELHMSPMRNNNSRMLEVLGPDSGFDSIGDWPIATKLSQFLDSLDREEALPRTILFNLNPRDTYVLGTMIGNFQAGYGNSSGGRLQLGPAWWFLDHLEGMRAQLQSLAELGSIGKFIGMTTDSRSFLSYPRHEYFRRIFCAQLGRWVEDGQYPADMDHLVELCRAVFFDNAKEYFGLKG